MSLALLYLRVFNLRTATRNLIYTLIAIISISSWAYILLLFFRCRPIIGAWNLAVKSSCLNLYPAFIGGAVIGVLIDLALVIIVFSCILGLKVQKVQKIGLLIIANLGWLTILSAILRTIKLDRVVRSSEDFTFRVMDIVTWTGAELCTMMICACAPVLRPLLIEFASWVPKGLLTTQMTDEEESSSTMQTGTSTITSKSEAGTAKSGLELISEKSSTELDTASEEFTDVDLGTEANRGTVEKQRKQYPQSQI
jgi:hypothetical protein